MFNRSFHLPLHYVRRLTISSPVDRCFICDSVAKLCHLVRWHTSHAFSKGTLQSILLIWSNNFDQYGNDSRFVLSLYTMKLYTHKVFSWGLTYNMYADILLGTNVFPSSVYDMRKYERGSSDCILVLSDSSWTQKRNGTATKTVSRYVHTVCLGFKLTKHRQIRRAFGYSVC